MSSPQSHFYEFGPYRLDTRTRVLLRDGEPQRLEPKVVETLLVLLHNRGEVVTKDDLMKAVWPDTFVNEDSLTRNIALLRKVLAEGLESTQFIETFPKRGYRFSVPVTERTDQDPKLVLLERTTATLTLEEEETGDAPAKHTTGVDAKTLPRARTLLRRRYALRALAGCVLGALLVLGWLAVWSNQPVQTPRLTKIRQLTNAAVSLRAGDEPLLTDGPRLFVTIGPAGQLTISSVATASASGEMRPIVSSAQSPTALDVSPDRSNLLASSGMGTALWLLPILGGSPRPLAGLCADDATWSPDGRTLFYTLGRNLFVANEDGTSSRKIATAPDAAWLVKWPCWSPDGKVLRLTVFDEKQQSASLWEVRADGGEIRPLLPGWGNGSNACCGNWTTDGKFYVFAAYLNGLRRIWAIRKRRVFEWRWPRPVQVTSDAIDYGSPLPSKDGRELFALGAQKAGELTRYDAKLKQFVPYLGGISAGDVAFSRDGKWVAYVKYPEGDLWRSWVDGSEKQQLTFPPLTADAPHWSPDGKPVAFRAGAPGQPRKIHLISRDGGQPLKLIPGIPDEDGVPTWSPNGKEILFGELRWHPEKIALHIINLTTRSISTVPSSRGLWTPRWSPSGRYILALTADNHEIRIFDFRTWQWTNLAGKLVADRGEVNDPNWSHDESYIYFNISPFAAGRAIYRVRAADGRLELVGSLQGFRTAYAAGTFGNWFGLAPDDSPLLLKDARNWDIYALDMEWPK